MWQLWSLAHPQFLCGLPHFSLLFPPVFISFLFFGFAGNAQILFFGQFAASGVKLYFALASAPPAAAVH